MLKSTMIGIFILVTYALLVIGLSIDTGVIAYCAIGMMLLNLAAFCLTYVKAATPPEQPKYGARGRQDALVMDLKKVYGREIRAKEKPEDARNKLLYNVTHTIIISIFTFLLLVVIMLLGIDSMIGSTFNLQFAVFSYLMACMLVIRMQWMHNYEVGMLGSR